MIALLLSTALALAAPLQEAELQAAWDASADLTVGEDTVFRDATGLTLDLDGDTLTFTDGILVPVAPASSEEPWNDVLGYVVVGAGELTVTFEDQGQADAFGNHRVRNLGEEVAAVAPMVSSRTWKTPVTRALVLTARPGLLMPAMDQPILADDDHNYAEAAREADKLLKRRAELHEGGQDPMRLVRADALMGQQLGIDLTDARALIDVDTDVPLKLDPDAKHTGGYARDSWVTVLLDQSGLWSDRNRRVVASLGETSSGRGTWRTFATAPLPRSGGADDTTSPPAAPVGWSPGEAHPKLSFDVAKGKNEVTVQGAARLEMAPHGGPMAWMVVDVPYVDARDGSWALEGIEFSVGGQPVPALILEAPSHSMWDQGYVRSNNLVLLGRAIQPDEKITVGVKWHDTWPWNNLTSVTGQAQNLGRGSGLQSAIPGISPGRVGSPWRFETLVDVPEDGPITASVSGLTTKEWTENGRRYTLSSHQATEAMWPDVAVGEWTTLTAPPREGLPSLRVHLFPEEGETALKGIAAETWQVITYYQQLLPPFPYEELELFQSPDMWFGFVWIAPHAMVAITQAKVVTGMRKYFTDDAPSLSEGVLAHEIAHQYWGHVARPGSINDFWIAETFAELYSCLYVRAAYGEAAWDSRMDDYREKWEDMGYTQRASLTDAYESPAQPQIVYNYGPYVMGVMLRQRLGDQAFLGGLNALLAAKPEQAMATEEIQLALEAASGKDLDAFFDFWVEGGHIPSLELTWEEVPEGKGKKVVGTIASDVPFGSFDVPVVVDAGKGSVLAWVTVDDGQGRFETDELPGGAKAKVKVSLDPDGAVLAVARKVRHK
ncbi:MAG: hypothetical protein H6742_16900 [Alphaproteobacteria bacterium]|nr:hypothetical protein [Alphaproteobacteria bacterium]